MGFFKRSIAAKVSLVIAFIVMMTAIMVSYLFYYSGSQVFEKKEYDDLALYSRFVKHRLVDLFYEVNSFADSIHAYEGSLNKRGQSFLSSFIKNNSRYLCIQTFTKNGSKVGALYSKEIDKLDSLYPRNKKNLKKIGADSYFVGFSLAKVGKQVVEPHLPIMMILIRKEKFDYILGVNFNYFLKIFKEEQVQNSYFYLFNSKGVFIQHPNILKTYSFDKIVSYSVKEEFNSSQVRDFLNSKASNLQTVVDYRKDSLLLHTEKVLFNDVFLLGIGVGILKGNAINFTPAIKGKNMMTGLFLILFFTILGWFFIRYLLKNLNEITDQAKLFTQGEHDINIEVKSKDEIGILALTFQGMIRQVNERTRVLRKSERSIREARDQAEQALSAKSQLLEDLRKQKSEIERVGKDKDDLLAIVSHDLKNPLAVIETSMDIILEEERTTLSPSASDLIRRSKNSARIALNLITDLLDLARLEGGIKLDFERFSIDELIENVVDSFYLKAKEKRINVKIHKEGVFDLIADYGRVVQIVSNILGNSLKFTPHDGEINITLSRYGTTDIHDGTHNGLEIKIEDNGPGIPPDKIEAIFNKFEQARKKDREIGTGLGLAICKNICELHNGDIQAQSSLGIGATFIIHLPRLIEHRDVEEGSVISNTILIVNDDGAFRKRTRNGLSKGGFNILEARNGEELLKVLETETPSLILLDNEMPVKSGLEALEELKEKGIGATPIIFMTEELSGAESESIKDYVLEIMPSDPDVNDVLQRIYSLLSPDKMTSLEKKLDENKRTILIVDDEEGIRSLLQENFSFIGYNCLVAKNGVEGLFLVQKYRIDLVISDIRMSEVDGLTLSKAIKKEYPIVPIILMSANVDKLSESLVERLGILEMLPKPFDVDNLNEYVATHIGGPFIGHSISVVRGKGVEKSGLNESSGEELHSQEKPKRIKKRVLLVDDSEDMQILFKALLRKENIEVDIAENGSDALEILKKNTYIAVFMDMNMPVMDGRETIGKLRSFEVEAGKTSQKVILLTANKFDSNEEITDLGFNGYLQKPLNKDKILKELNDGC